MALVIIGACGNAGAEARAPSGARALPEVQGEEFPPIQIDQRGDQTVVTLYEAVFDTALAVITPDGERNLQSVLGVLPAAGDVQVHGYTDGVGSNAYNDQLSRERAASVVGWLSEHGVKPGRLKPQGFGEKGAADNVDDRTKRRVEVIFETVEGDG